MKREGLVVLAVAIALLAPASCRSGRDGAVQVITSDFGTGTADGWTPNDPSHWRVADDHGSKVYELSAPGSFGPIRTPTSWSVWTGTDSASFEFSGRMKCYTDPAVPGRDMCVFFHYQDPSHFYYVHFAAESAEFHNIIGLVNGADRVKINAEPAGGSMFRLTDRAWHAFKVTCDAATGEIRAYLDDLEAPILTARDRTLGHGLVGVGSFDDTGAFDGLRLRILAK